jgi:hypothetical protein
MDAPVIQLQNRDREEAEGAATTYLITWARHGSTRYRWTGDSVRAAIEYVVREQGPAMAVFERSSPR